MKFIEAIQAVFEGASVKRESWIANTGVCLGVSNWLVKLDPTTDNNPSIFIFEGNNKVGKIELTKLNFESNDWTIVDAGYEVELAALKKKYNKN